MKELKTSLYEQHKKIGAKIVPFAGYLMPVNYDKGIKEEHEQSFIERIGEKILWSTRYVVLIAVISSVLAAIALFGVGSYEIFNAILNEIPRLMTDHREAHDRLLVGVIAGIDLYLIGVVLMIFGFGIYELFISKIDIARSNLDITILEIENLDELKQKIIKVIIMVLIVTFFERIIWIGKWFVYGSFTIFSISCSSTL